MPLHLEFVRFDGEIACFGLQLVRFTTDERLDAIIAYHEEQRLPDLQPARLHARGRRHEAASTSVQLAFKREADPQGLLNPGKMLGWEDPGYGQEEGRAFLYESR